MIYYVVLMQIFMFIIYVESTVEGETKRDHLNAENII